MRAAAITVVMLAIDGAFAQQDAHDEWTQRIDAAREHYDEFAARAIASFRDAAAARSHEQPRAPFRLDDPTLRPGDIVVTPNSLLLFKGSPSCAFDEAAFERVDEHRARRLPHARALRAILRSGAHGRGDD